MHVRINFHRIIYIYLYFHVDNNKDSINQFGRVITNKPHMLKIIYFYNC